jgi:hypothetical protein
VAKGSPGPGYDEARAEIEREMVAADFEPTWVTAALDRFAAAVREQIAAEIEGLPRAWHFRGPGDPGIEIVSREAAIEIARGTPGDQEANRGD